MRRCRNDYHKGQGRNLGNIQLNRKKVTKFPLRKKKTYIVKQNQTIGKKKIHSLWLELQRTVSYLYQGGETSEE
jgi:hypothetical protein